ncbi:MAG: DNA gyrase subunit A [Candidatus Woesearchaeota archaeon]
MTDNEKIEHSNIIPQVIEDEMKDAYLDYSMSVIVGRALPDARDGLKPVHRRILFAMHSLGMTHKSSYRKSARIVGEVLGRLHPHGDSAVYDSLVRMAQPFSLRYPLVDGQGNFGSVDGDNAAAMRYTEARLQKISQELLDDLEKETVDFMDNFDGTMQEPTVLPNKIPNLLINGSTGIAVGMATNIPPHNLKEVCDGAVALIENPDIEDSDLFELVKGPDFPTGGIILGRRGIYDALKTGRGRVVVRSKIHVEEKNDRKKLVVTEIPYMVNKANLVEQIADLVKDKKVEGISDLRDESDRQGMRIVIDLKRDAEVEVVKNQLFKYSRLQDSFSVLMLALVKNQPKTLNLRELLAQFILHRKDVVRRRTEFDLKKSEARAHILEGLLIALDNIDEVIALIKASGSSAEAKTNLMSSYDLSEDQSQAILEMRLQKLAKLESTKIKEEYDELMKLIKELKEILADEQKILDIIREELVNVSEQYGDDRRSAIDETEYEDVDMEDLIPEEDMVVTLSKEGYVKRTSIDTYKVQRRGGVGVIGSTNKEDDFTTSLFIANTHSYLLVFTDKGIVHWLKVYKIPESSRYSKGKAIVNLIDIGKEENISAVIPVKEFSEDKFLLIATRNGIVKKTSLSAYSRPRRNGIIACTLDEGDEVVGVKLTTGSDEVMLATRKGMACKFNEQDARPIGRTSRGVKGITLKGDDKVVSMIIVNDETDVLTLTSKGYGKRTVASMYRLINRGGKGVININCTSKNGEVVSVKSVLGDEQLMLTTKKGMVVRTKVESISSIGRNTQGVRVIRLREDDELMAAAKLILEDEQDEPVESSD